MLILTTVLVVAEEGGEVGEARGYHVMEFFEMCAALIAELAR